MSPQSSNFNFSRRPDALDVMLIPTKLYFNCFGLLGMVANAVLISQVEEPLRKMLSENQQP